MKAKKKELKELAPAELGLGPDDLAPRVLVRKLTEPPKRKGGVKVQDVQELWKRLHEEAKVL
jgi:electron transfer flavoprotein beta subunit